MSRNIYALTVGIDNYKSCAIPSLKGCVNDVIAVEDFLKTRLTNSDDTLHIKTLINHQATRQAIINAFREHLCQATSTDIALFYFSGHGSQEEAAQMFWDIEPDHLNETLVCWDSRTENNWDLADKELSYLIAEVSQKHPHFVVILDCCHSGGALRSRHEYTGARSVETNFGNRPLLSYIFSNKLKSPADFQQLSKEYILLAACRDNEEAREHYSQKRGVFSYFLLDTLQRHGNLTYREALKRTNALVRSFYPNQSPQIETTNSDFLDQPLFGGAVVSLSYFTVSYDGANSWNIDAGAVHGIVTSRERTRLAIFSFDVENISNLQDAVAIAEIVEVLPQLSKIHISGERDNLNPQLIYKAVITSSSVWGLKVYLEGDETGVRFLRQAIQQACFGETSLYINEVYTRSEAEFRIQAISGQYLIIRTSDNQELIPAISDYTVTSACSAIHALEHIARWMNIATLSNPDNSELQDAVLMQIYQQSEISDYQISLKYQVNNNSLQPPAIQIKFTNTSDKAVYCALLNLTQVFAINVISFGYSTGVWLEPKQEVWVQEGKPIPITIPQHMMQQGVTLYKDILKLLVSTSEFDARLLEQPSIDQKQITRSNFSSPTSASWYDIHKVLSRAIVACPSEPETPEASNSWATQEILITTVIPQKDYVTQPNSKVLNSNKESQTETNRLPITGKLCLIGVFSLASILIIMGIFAFKRPRQYKIYIPSFSYLTTPDLTFHAMLRTSPPTPLLRGEGS
jgi:Caspase domain